MYLEEYKNIIEWNDYRAGTLLSFLFAIKSVFVQLKERMESRR